MASYKTSRRRSRKTGKRSKYKSKALLGDRSVLDFGKQGKGGTFLGGYKYGLLGDPRTQKDYGGRTEKREREIRKEQAERDRKHTKKGGHKHGFLDPDTLPQPHERRSVLGNQKSRKSPLDEEDADKVLSSGKPFL